MGFAGSFRSCRAIQGGFLLLAINDTWSLPSLSRSTHLNKIRVDSPSVKKDKGRNNALSEVIFIYTCGMYLRVPEGSQICII